MKNDVAAIQSLLTEIAALLKSGTKVDRRAASGKLKRLAAMAETLSLTLILLKNT
jgi:hypothetical protein